MSASTSKRNARSWRAVVKIGSQEDPDFLFRVASEFPPTIVIDDGSHIAHHMIASFEALFPALAPGGVYVIEDLAFHFEDGVGQWQGAKAHQGLSGQSIYGYFEPFLRARLANLATPRDAWGFARYAFENIDSIALFGSGMAIRKRAKRPYAEEIARMEALAPRMADVSSAKHRLAGYLIKHNQDLDRAYDLLKQACDASPNDVQALELIYVVTTWTRRFEEAASHAEKIASLRPNAVRSWQRLAEAYQRTSRHQDELQALRRLVEWEPGVVASWLRISVLAEQTGDLQGAISSARRAAELTPQDAQTVNRVKSLGAKLEQAGG